jgi:SAM-dependent methyltransferase
MPFVNNAMSQAAAKISRLGKEAGLAIASLPLRLTTNPALPGPRLLHRVCGTCDARWFLDSGKMGAQLVADALARQGRSLLECEAILDFGCGIGRVLRNWSNLNGPRLHGTDRDPTLIAWCRRHLPFAHFEVNTLEPRLCYPGASFDVVTAFSVFTHLGAARQEGWMAEFSRVLRPGGLLIISLHGTHYMPVLNHDQRNQFREGSLVVVGEHGEGTNTCAAFHPEAYVRIVLARDWDLREFSPEGAIANPSQDLYILRKPTGASARIIAA